ncbi:hypothetical protein OPIT5_03955 [Opitutaceae bacterium TAV5]|nr:hypothetical protein OPIT5_03955 [Opitutaceae bacterium TAV5]
MAEYTKIEWCDHTFNPWIGCTKVSPGCAHCYAAAQDAFRHWTPAGFGKGKPRKRTSEANWRQVLRWDREAARFAEAMTSELKMAFGPDGGHLDAPRRPRVFCASLADWLDPEVPVEWLTDLLDLIRRTQHLDWQLLTKRPELWEKRIGQACGLAGKRGMSEAGWSDTWGMAFDWLRGGIPPANVWIGTTVENQDMADKRIPELLKIPARVRFLSVEPMLGPVDLYNHLHDPSGGEEWTSRPSDLVQYGIQDGLPLMRRGIHWVICGGESGPHARPMHPAWARSLRDQCAAANVPFFFKQQGEWREPLPGEEYDTSKGRASSPPAFIVAPDGSVHCYHSDRTNGGAVMVRVGKKAAGRLLDGVEHNGRPEVQA